MSFNVTNVPCFIMENTNSISQQIQLVISELLFAISKMLIAELIDAHRLIHLLATPKQHFVLTFRPKRLQNLYLFTREATVIPKNEYKPVHLLLLLKVLLGEKGGNRSCNSETRTGR